MNRKFAIRVAALLLWTSSIVVPLADAAPQKGLCPVCIVERGEADEEAVRATRTYEGREYGFCSEKCAKAFMADPAAYLPPSLPRPSPSFELTDLEGQPLSIGSLEGKVVLLDFWATWCVPCRRSMPALQALHEKFSTRGFTVVGISIDEGDTARVRRFVASKKITYPIAMDSLRNPAWEAFRVKAIPAAYLIDREGRIVAQWTGALADVPALEASVEELVAAD